MFKKFLSLTLPLLFPLFVFANTGDISLALSQCDSLFLKNNLLLLASQFNIDAQTAMVIQSRLWENPFLAGDFNAIDPENKKYFHDGKDGEKALAVQQLIYLGNKKHNEIELAKTDVRIAELDYQDLLRELRYQLRLSYFSTYYDNQTLSYLDFQINNLDTLINGYAEQSQKGNIPLKDLVRLQSLYLTLRNNRSDLINSLIAERQKLSLITGLDSVIIPAPLNSELAVYDHTLDLPVDSLENLAFKNRPDLMIAETQITQSEWNLRLQKSLVVPDITLGASYDQHSGAFRNMVDLTLGLPLVLWNRNQGNIKMAGDRLNASKTLQQQKKLEVSSEIAAVYQRYHDALQNARLISSSTYSNFITVYNGVFRNFQRRNISLLEFTDFMESYNESINQSNEFKKTLINISEEINYATGSTIF